jgi:hypothetical protein
VSHAGIVAGQREATLERMKAEDVVLLLQDTSSFDFSHHPGTSGSGPLENERCQGIMVHSTLAVNQHGLPLGVLEQQVWVRQDEETRKAQRRWNTPFEEKESYKWVKGLPSRGKTRPDATWVTVCDREGHIYECLAEVLSHGLDLVVRAVQGHSTTVEGQELFESVRALPVRHQMTVTLKRRPDREAREAQVELRFAPIRLQRPAKAKTDRDTMTPTVIDVLEPNPPEGESALHWLLLTSLPVQTWQQAEQIVRWYAYRWLIERFHYVLKSGCQLEERQLRTEPRLERLLAVFSLVAWKLLWMTYQSRQNPEASCTLVFQTLEWQALWAFIHRSQRLPSTPPTVRQVQRWIAQLGGFLGRRGDGEPGVKVLGRGWIRLQDIVDTWTIFHPQTNVGNA